MSGKIYSDKENDLLLDDLKKANNCVLRQNFIDMADLWEGLFKGTKRTAFALCIQTIRLAKENHISFHVHTMPKRNRNNHIERKYRRSHKNVLHEQVRSIVQNELKNAQKRIAASIMRLFDDLTQENIDCREEIKMLKPFKELVETSYRKEIEFRTGS